MYLSNGALANAAADVSTGKLNIDTVARLKPMAKPPVPATAGDIY